MNHGRGPTGPQIGFGCLAIAILMVIVAAGVAIVFVWDVNAPH